MQEEFIRINNLTEEEYKYLTRGNKKIFCVCGEFRKLVRSNQSKIGVYLGKTCGKKQCSKTYGRKRPEHSIKMKELVKDPNSNTFRTVMKKGELHNKKVNSDDFKKRVLMNKNIDFTEENFNEVFSKMLSDQNKSRENREKVILSIYSGFSEEYKKLFLLSIDKIFSHKEVSIENIQKLNDFEFSNLYKILWGLNTLRNMEEKSTGSNSFYSRIFMENLKYNTQGKNFVRTRSGMEAKFIKFFEDNQIPWSYEEHRILCIDQKSFYTPDFLINYNGSLILLEVKGAWYRQDKEEYYSNKLAAGINFSKEKGYDFYITHHEPQNNSFLDKAIPLFIKEPNNA